MRYWSNGVLDFPRLFFAVYNRFLGIFFIFTLLLCNLAYSQKLADDYYHGASAMYIEGRVQQAVIEVEEGLRKHPHNQKLNAFMII